RDGRVTRAFAGLWTTTRTWVEVAPLPKSSRTELGVKENCQSPGVPEKENVSATFPVFRTSIVYVTESPAGINHRLEASYVIATARETTLASRRSPIASAWG